MEKVTALILLIPPEYLRNDEAEPKCKAKRWLHWKKEKKSAKGATEVMEIGDKMRNWMLFITMDKSLQTNHTGSRNLICILELAFFLMFTCLERFLKFYFRISVLFYLEQRTIISFLHSTCMEI